MSPQKYNSLNPEQKRLTVLKVFDDIASKYDFLNRVISLGQDPRWRKKTIGLLKIKTNDKVLDIGCGTGDMSLLALKYSPDVISMDPSMNMLRFAKQKGLTLLVCAEAEKLPFKTNCFDKVTTAFTIRNFSSLTDVFNEIKRVLKIHGRFCAIDIGQPRNFLMKNISVLWFSTIVPQLGALLGLKKAYVYLNNSLSYIPDPQELRSQLTQLNFSNVGFKELFFSNVYSIFASKESDD